MIWSKSAHPADWYGSPNPTQIRRNRRFRRGMRLAVLLTLMGVMCVVRHRPRHWCAMLTGTLLWVAGVKLGGGWSVLIFVGIWFQVYSIVLPERPYADWDDQPRDKTRRPGLSSR